MTPEQFALVNFRAIDIVSITEGLVQQFGLGSLDVHIEVDETTPLTRALLRSVDPIVINAESGALEDPRKIRTLSRKRTTETIGRLLLRARDRRAGGGFEAAPDDTQLSLAQSAAWDSYANGRLDRMGHGPHKPRWQYHFRNRHGFTDVADECFDSIWSSDQLTWEQMDSISARALAMRPG